MSETLFITREPFAIQGNSRPALHIMPDAVYALVVTDPSLDFEENRAEPGYGTLLYKAPASSDGSDEQATGQTTLHRFAFTRKGLRSTCTEAPIVLKLLEIAKKLKAHVLSDYGALYFRDENGLVNVTEDAQAKSYIIGDKGTRYALTPDGALADPASLPAYLAENDFSFLPETQAEPRTEQPQHAEKPEKRQANSHAPAAPDYCKGLGTLKCSLFSRAYQKNVQLSINAYYAWCLSFLSGINCGYQEFPEQMLRYPIYPSTSNEDIAFLNAYCTRNPDAPFISACLALRTMRLERQ